MYNNSFRKGLGTRYEHHIIIDYIACDIIDVVYSTINDCTIYDVDDVVFVSLLASCLDINGFWLSR